LPQTREALERDEASDKRAVGAGVVSEATTYETGKPAPVESAGSEEVFQKEIARGNSNIESI
jgi:hypothetical protein